MTAEEMIKEFKCMENGESLDFLDYLYHEHFNFTSLREEEHKLINAYRFGDLNSNNFSEFFGGDSNE